MSLPDVLKRGDKFLAEYPRHSKFWQWVSHTTCLATIAFSKLVLSLAYNVKLTGYENLENAISRTLIENRGLVTIMNHMSTVDDPFVWGILPWKLFKDLDTIRWGLGAHNVCFQNKFLSHFFSLGKVLATERFGVGPFQGSIDASIRLLSPDDTLDLKWSSVRTNSSGLGTGENLPYIPPVRRMRPSWVHVFPEGFVVQLQSPHANSMRYFKWGIARLILESTKPPIVVPMFGIGFEKIAPEHTNKTIFDRCRLHNIGTEVKLSICEPIDDSIIMSFREEWRKLVEKYHDPANPTDLSKDLREGIEAQNLRSRLASVLREHVAKIRCENIGLSQEDPKFKSPEWWKNYTQSKGESDKDIKMFGQD